MTMLLSGFGLLGRFAGDLLTSALSWASSLLFGRVPRSHQIFLVLMMAGSFLWLVIVLVLLVPSAAALLLSSTPHPPFVDRAWLGFALLLGLGVDELSMTPTLLPAVKFLIRAMKMSDAQKLAKEALVQTDPKKTYALVEAFYNERVKVE